jgi:nitrogen fixation protein NifU and related proteins
MYSSKVLQQFQNAQRVGDLPDADAYVQVDNPACGDILRMSLKVRNGQIVDARFRVRGCVAAVACGAQLTEMICDRSIAHAKAIEREHLIGALGGLPPASIHASQLAIDALQRALKQLG